jgi:hypothetical protein
MRIAIAATALILLSACQVSKDEGNDTTTVQFNEAVAENGLDRAGEVAGNLASGVANGAQEVGQSVKNEVGDVDVDVDVNRNTGNAQ